MNVDICSMQLVLPIFPKTTKMLSASLGVYTQEGMVHYIANGLPVYCHAEDNLAAFRSITCNFIERGLCRSSEVARCFGIPDDSVRKQLSRYRGGGEEAFYRENRSENRSHKLKGDLLKKIQDKLDKGQSNNSIAKQAGIHEGAIRYAIKMGRLKKKA